MSRRTPTNLSLSQNPDAFSVSVQFFLDTLRPSSFVRIGVVHEAIHVDGLIELHIRLGFPRLKAVTIKLHSLRKGYGVCSRNGMTMHAPGAVSGVMGVDQPATVA